MTSALAEIAPLAEQAVLILLGTFVGAASAFALQRRHDHADEIRKYVGAGRWAQFVLASQANFLVGMDKQHLAAHHDDPRRGLLLGPMSVGHDTPALSTRDLAFLFEMGPPDLLNELLIGQQSFESVLGVLAQRNPLHLEFQERCRQAERDGSMGQTPTLDTIEVAVGKNVVRQLEGLTEQLYTHWSQATDWNAKNSAALLEALRDVFPKHKFLNIVPIDD